MNNQLSFPLVGLPKQFSFIQVVGAQASTFLQGQLTCDVGAVQANQASLAACCDHKGRVLFNGWLGRWQQDFVLMIPTSMLPQAITHLQKFAVFSKVVLSEKLDWRGLIYCGKELSSLQNAACLQAKLSLTGDTEHLLYWLWGPAETLQTVQNNLTAITTAEPEQLAYLMVLAHLVYIQPPTSELFIPQMIDLEKLGGVSLNKGCYVGQEIIARTTYLGQLKRHLQMLKIPAFSPLPLIGDLIFNEKKENVGQFVAVAKDLQSNSLTLAVIQDRALTDPLFYYPDQPYSLVLLT